MLTYYGWQTSGCQNIATTYFVFSVDLPWTCICDFPSSFSILPIELQPFNTTSIRSQGLEIPSHRKACRQEPDSPKTEALRFVPFEIYFLSLETKLRKLTSLKGTCFTVESEVWNHLFPLLLPSGPRLVNLKGWSGKTTSRWLWTQLKTFPVFLMIHIISYQVLTPSPGGRGSKIQDWADTLSVCTLKLQNYNPTYVSLKLSLAYDTGVYILPKNWVFYKMPF